MLFSPQVLKAAKFQGLTADLTPWFYESVQGENLIEMQYKLSLTK